MKLELHYINLEKRRDRNELMIKNWNEVVLLNRINGTEFKTDSFGTRGCFESHRKVLKMLAIDNNKELNIISEDDIIPSSSFNQRLELVLDEVPRDWDILLLGYSISERSKYRLVTNNIAKAEKDVLSGTCYIINPSFYSKMLDEYKKFSIESNLDALLMNANINYNVYMAIPSLCFQYESFSDNSKMTLKNTEMTKTLFVD